MLYKFTVWQYRIIILLTILFIILSLIWFIYDLQRIEPITVLLGGLATISSLIWPKPNYGNKRDKGRDYFNYSSNDGVFIIGKSESSFDTKWTRGSDRHIHLYNDELNIEKIALAKNVYNFNEIRNPDVFDFSSRVITLEEGEIAVLINKNGFYALVKIVDIKDKTRTDDRDELTIEWIINPAKNKDFS